MNRLDIFFKPLTREELEQGKEEIERYNAKAREHEMCGEVELTAEKLFAIAKQKNLNNKNSPPNDDKKSDEIPKKRSGNP